MYNLIQYASGPIKIYNLPIHLYYIPFKQLLINLCYPTTTTIITTTTNTHTNINIVNKKYVILQIKDLHYVSCSL